jgi:hypothetical protein
VQLSWSGSGGVLADSKLVFYVDEAGNTGANHLDRDQPYYVAAGWLLRDIDVGRADAAVARARKATERNELKGAKMLKTVRGTRAAHELVIELLRFCTPVIVIIEKHYALWSRAVEAFVFHPAGAYFGRNHPDRATGRAFATSLCKLPSSVAWHVERYLQTPTRQLAFACIEALQSALTSAELYDLAHEVENARRAPSEWWNPDEISKRSYSPNVMGFNTLLQNLEMLGIRCGQQISIVHDRIIHLEEVYSFYQNFAATNLGMFPELFEKSGCPGGLTHVGAPQFVESRSEPLIQAADVLSSSVLALLKNLSRLQLEGSRHHHELAVLLLWGFVEPELASYFHFIGSNSIGGAAGQQLIEVFELLRYQSK